MVPFMNPTSVRKGVRSSPPGLHSTQTSDSANTFVILLPSAGDCGTFCTGTFPNPALLASEYCWGHIEWTLHSWYWCLCQLQTCHARSINSMCGSAFSLLFLSGHCAETSAEFSGRVYECWHSQYTALRLIVNLEIVNLNDDGT